MVAQIRERVNLRVISCCYDLIPFVRPDLTLDRIIQPFTRYLDDLILISDHVVCISSCTAKDLSFYLGKKPRAPAVSIIKLGSRPGHAESVRPSALIAPILRESFVLFVSTIERRKNHEILLEAYSSLLSEGQLNLPVLVFVGMRGWGAERFFEKLAADPVTAGYVRLLHHVSDHDLSHLYRRSLFTVYPSLYEGWGLPVAESLAQGKFCIASQAASIPEVGGDLVEYCAPDDARAWGVAIYAFANDPQALMAREERILMEYHPPEWRDTVHQIMQVALPQGVT
jgi:glycosyltransferase involved in cell wall biosynthesis